MKKIMVLTKDDVFYNKLLNRMKYDQFQLMRYSEIEQTYLPLEEDHYHMIIFDLDQTKESEGFLKFLLKHYPRVIRINTTTSQYGVDSKAQSYAQMSWVKTKDINDLIFMVEKLLEMDDRINNPELLNLVSNLRHLPTLPRIYNELSFMIENNESIENIAETLESDPSISANILKLANSAFYNAKTGSIKQAMMYIGLNNVKNIILTTAVFDHQSLDDKYKEVHWKHVSLANKLLNAIYIEILGKKLNNNISAVGLLHDVGSIVLMCNFPRMLNEIIGDTRREEERDIYIIEKDRIGFSHEELGGHLLDFWGLPTSIVEVALYHHTPLNPNIINKELLMTMHIADYYAWKAFDEKNADETLNMLVFSEIGYPKSVFDAFFEKFMASEKA